MNGLNPLLAVEHVLMERQRALAQADRLARLYPDRRLATARSTGSARSALNRLRTLMARLLEPPAEQECCLQAA